MLKEQSERERETETQKWRQEMDWQAELNGEDAEAFAREAESFMSDGAMDPVGARDPIPAPAEPTRPQQHQQQPEREPDSPTGEEVATPKGIHKSQESREKPEKGRKLETKEDQAGRENDNPKTKGEKEETARNRAREKEARLLERVELKLAATGKELLEDVDDFMSKLLATAQDAALQAAKIASLPEQQQLLQKLQDAEKGMKECDHQLTVKQGTLKRHTANDYSELIGKSVQLIEKFRRVENQATPEITLG